MEKGRNTKPADKWKKHVVISTPGPVTSTLAGPSSNLRSKLHDKAKVTAAMIQELTEELQSIDQESLNDKWDSEAMQESDMEQEDSEWLSDWQWGTMTKCKTKFVLPMFWTKGNWRSNR